MVNSKSCRGTNQSANGDKEVTKIGPGSISCVRLWDRGVIRDDRRRALQGPLPCPARAGQRRSCRGKHRLLKHRADTCGQNIGFVAQVFDGSHADLATGHTRHNSCTGFELDRIWSARTRPTCRRTERGYRHLRPCRTRLPVDCPKVLRGRKQPLDFFLLALCSVAFPKEVCHPSCWKPTRRRYEATNGRPSGRLRE
jgi:hypothetical protein